jgi:two-component system, NarL family, response regulator
VTDSAEKMVRILIADDHFLVREGLRAILGTAPDFHVIGEAVNGRQALDLYEHHKPDVVILDMRMPELDGQQTITELITRFPDAKVVALSNFESEEDIHQALTRGARTFLPKRLIDRLLPEFVRDVARGIAPLADEVRDKMAARESLPRLSPRECEILELVAHGKSNKEICHTLSLSRSTVSTHLDSSFRKLNADDRTEAAMIAIRRGFIRGPG